ncbi:MAG: right-handed parallel beta-helix repeat-containing protein [Clostridia bacterium]|nr:right-handed parallel beta-helix repeat-containing protein [Clostridia bacterium]
MEKIFQMTPETAKTVRRQVWELLKSGSAPDTVTVRMAKGLYDPDDFSFTKEDCADGVRVVYSADKGAVIHGGLTVAADEWTDPDTEMLERIPENARGHVRMISLTAKGLTAKEWGEEIPFGSSATATLYDDVPKGCGSEFFTGGRRMIKARYPNAGEYLKLDAVADVGECYEFPPQNYYPERRTMRNPRGGCYIVDHDTNDRIKKWKDPSTAWIYGYLYWDWADSATPVRVNPERREIWPKYVSHFGARAGAHYYLYNVPEELDSEGEWYLDRKTGNLYFWPWSGAESADFSFRGEPLLNCTDTKNITFSGLGLTCCIANAVVCSGENMIFERLAIDNIRENAISVSGSNNTVSRCTMRRLGGGGIIISGGERQTLTPGNNRAENNLIDDFAQVYQTYRPGIILNGVGNAAVHNEISNSPHAAIFYGGNNHLIEYNEIHDVIKLSSDAGAIYAGRDSVAYGTVIRYNRIMHNGSGEFVPQGIYWDDALNGQTAYGNIIADTGWWGVEVGGGRDHVVENNVIVRMRDAAIEYDDRIRRGVGNPHWWYQHHPEHLKQFKSVDREKGPWAQQFPALSRVVLEGADPEDKNAFFNPANSSVCNNVAIACKKLYEVEESVKKFSRVENNPAYESAEEAGWDEKAHNLRPDSRVFRDLPGFKAIPADKIGIEKE